MKTYLDTRMCFVETEMAAFVPDTRVSVMFLYRRWGLNEIISSSLE